MHISSRTFIFAALLVFGGLPSADAKVIRCDAIFQPTVQDILEKIDGENSQFLLNGKSFEEYTQNLSWFRKRKIRRLVNDLEVRSFPSDKALERYTIELGTALFGSKELVDRWLFKSGDQRLEESTILIIKEQLLKEGFLKTWNDIYNPEKIGLLKKLLDRVWNLQASRLGDLTRLPFALPSLKNKSLSSELMYKVIRDGFNPHAEEVRIALGQQGKIEAYNTFRKLYAPVFFSVMLIVQMEHAYHDLQVAIDEQVLQTTQQLREQRNSLENGIPLIKQEMFQKAYAAAVAEFTQKWGEAPTQEESALLKAKIEKALNMS